MQQGRGSRASKDVVLAGVGFGFIPWGDLEHEIYHKLGSTLW